MLIIDLKDIFLNLCVGDLSAEDPMHGLVYSAHAEPLSESAAVVLCLHALWGCNTRPMEAGRGYQSPGGCGL